MKHLEINLAKGKNQKNEIFQKVKEIFLKTYNTIPENPKDHQHLIYVEEKTKILGTMGLIFSEEINEKMPYENYFLIEKKKNLAFIDEAHVYLTSWVSEKKDVGLILSYCSGIFSISKKCKYAVSIMKPNIARYLSCLGRESVNT